VTESLFPSCRTEAELRAAAIIPSRYARTRNALSGDVSRLSPYLTHGLISVPDVIAFIAANHRIGWDDKIVFELGWREYFHHVWSRLGDNIWTAQQTPPAPHYDSELPIDIRTAQTGVAIIDQQIRSLYTTGYLHNHARMWIASYVVHMRKIDWQAGARWMYGHLLDGDLASNTLSWQWVAGTWTGKPYLFNAENVARYAPDTDCRGSVIDATYEELGALSRSSKAGKAERNVTVDPVAEPALYSSSPHPFATPTDQVGEIDFAFHLIHPWSLYLPGENPAIGIINTDFHREFPWSERRWQFVAESMRRRCRMVVEGNTASLRALINEKLVGKRLLAANTSNPHYRDLMTHTALTVSPEPRAFANPAMLKRSFTSFWNHVSRDKFANFGDHDKQIDIPNI
jgi:deoxyribodipyrimidine photo-lyase